MKYFNYVVPANKVRIYPLVCLHIGAAQSDQEFIEEHIARIKKDPDAKVVYMGDGGECVTKMSKGDVFSQTMNPTEQLKTVIKLFKPIKDKLLFAIDGNHGKRTFKETGLSWDESLSLALDIPYYGTSAFGRIQVGDVSYDTYFHHGIDSGVNVGGKINKAKAFENLVIADSMFSAHSHICCEIPPMTRAYLHGGIRHLTTYEYVCGCAYDSRTGYAEDKGYPPILPAYLAVEFDGRTKKQTTTIWRKEA